jgi:hypothetical protein
MASIFIASQTWKHFQYLFFATDASPKKVFFSSFSPSFLEPKKLAGAFFC